MLIRLHRSLFKHSCGFSFFFEWKPEDYCDLRVPLPCFLTPRLQGLEHRTNGGHVPCVSVHKIADGAPKLLIKQFSFYKYILLTSIPSWRAGRSGSNLEFLGSLEFCARRWWPGRQTLSHSLPAPLFPSQLPLKLWGSISNCQVPGDICFCSAMGAEDSIGHRIRETGFLMCISCFLPELCFILYACVGMHAWVYMYVPMCACAHTSV